MKQSDFLRGYICAVATVWRQHADPVVTRDLLACAASVECIIADADAADVETLREAGLLTRKGAR